MRRRHLLALGLAGISGCAGLGLGSGGDDGSTETPAQTAGETPTPTPAPTATAAPTQTLVRATDSQSRPLSTDIESLDRIEVDVLPDSVPFVHGARIEAANIDEGDGETLVPRLTVRVRNRTGRARALESDVAGLPLPRRRLRGPNGNAIVVRRRFREGATECSSEFQPTPEPTATATPAATSTGETREIGPGETITGIYRIFGNPGNPGGCFPSGRYTLRQPYAAVTDESRQRYRWGFSLEIR